MTRTGAAPLPRRSLKGDRRRKELVDIAARLFTPRWSSGPPSRTSPTRRSSPGRRSTVYKAVVVGRLAESCALAPAAVDLAGFRPEKIPASARRIHGDRAGWSAASPLTWPLGAQNRTPAIVAARDRPKRLLRALIHDAAEAGELRPVDRAMLSRLIFPAINRIPRRRRSEGRLAARRVADRHPGMIVKGVGA